MRGPGALTDGGVGPPEVGGPWAHLLGSPDSDKATRFHRVAWAVAHHLLQGSPVRVATVARRAGVSRPWIYKYLGSDPDDLVAFAVRTYAEAFGAPLDGPLDDRERLRAGTRKGLDDVLLAPWCVVVLFRGRHARNALGAAIRDALDRQTAALAGRLPGEARDRRARALVFESARLALYHEWLDPRVRAQLEPDLAVELLLRLV